MPPHCELPLNLDAPRHLLCHVRLALRGQCTLLSAEEVQDARRVARRRREVSQIERHQIKRYDARSRAAFISPTDSAGRMTRKNGAAQNGAAQNGAAQNGAARNGAAWHGAARRGAGASPHRRNVVALALWHA